MLRTTTEQRVELQRLSAAARNALPDLLADIAELEALKLTANTVREISSQLPQDGTPFEHFFHPLRSPGANP